MDELYPCSDEEGWKCRKHPAAQPRTGGVCPVCLRGRLLRLCPDCASERPCGCSCPSTTSSSFSSVSSFDLPRSGAGASIGAVGRVSHLIETEPAFRRSRSAAFRLLRPRSDALSDGAGGGGLGGAPSQATESKGRSWLWPFWRAKKEEREEAKNAAAMAVARLSRSRSVGVVPAAYSFPREVDVAGGGGGDVRWKVWNRYFPSPMKAFRYRKTTTKVVQARSPLCRG